VSGVRTSTPAYNNACPYHLSYAHGDKINEYYIYYITNNGMNIFKDNGMNIFKDNGMKKLIDKGRNKLIDNGMKKLVI